MEKALSIHDLFKQNFSLYKKHFFAISFIYSILFFVLIAGNKISADFVAQFDGYAKWTVAVLNFFVQAFVGMGLIYIAIRIDRKRAPSWDAFLQKADNFFQFLASLLIFSAGFYFLLYLFILPAFLFLARFLFALYVSVDKGFNPLASFIYSYKISKGSTLFVLFYIFSLLVLNLLSAVLVLPLFFSVPFTIISMANLYKELDEKYISNGAEALSLDKTLSKREKIIVYILATLVLLWGVMVFASRTGAFLSKSSQTIMQITNTQRAKKQKLLKAKLLIEAYFETRGTLPQSLQELKDLDPNFNPGKIRYTVIDNSSYKICIKDMCL